MEFPRKTPEYEELKELHEPWGICYGPLQSRRLGLSLGVNLLGSQDKICSFDCPYCELGLTKLKMSQMKKAPYPQLSEIDSSVRNGIVELTKKGVKIDAITFDGNGETTLYPEFPEAVSLIMKIRDDLASESRVVALTNGATLDNAKIIRALNQLDDRMVKLDAGNDEMMKKINSPLVRMTVAKLIQGAKRLNDVTIQSMFLQGAIDNTNSHEIDEWIEAVGMIRPKTVHLYSLDRIPAISGLKQVPSQRLKEIAQLLQKRTQIKASVFS
jgi:wyosine [tRNA(Phe)-imidazoG37] synthetase (radical SAM superfamily)